MRRAALFAVLLAAATGGISCSSDDEVTLFEATLSPENEVPPRSSPASGVSRMTFDGTTVTFIVVVSNLNNVTLAHIHSAPAGTNGPVRVDFYLGPVTSIQQGTLVQGSFTAADVRGIEFNALIDEMRAGNAYVNVHSQTYPAGEIRGQTRLLN
jgi:hypothetical protein